MKKAYIDLLIGTILMFLSFQIPALDLIIHIAGYGLMILGMLLILQKRESTSLLIASELTIGLLIFEVFKVGITRVILSNTLLSIGVATLILIIQLAIFYLILKSETGASESREVKTYQQTEFLFSIGLLILYFICYFSTLAFSLFTILDLCFYFFILYVFYKLITKYHY